MKKLTIIIAIIYLFICFAQAKETKTKKSISFGGQSSKKIPLGKSSLKPQPFVFSSQNYGEAITYEKKGFEIGIKAGGSAGLSGALGEVSYSLNPIIRGGYLRGGIGYLTGIQPQQNQQLKIATVNLDAVYSLGEINTFNYPLNVYIGGGLIYPIKVNRQDYGGAWGARAYFGSKYILQNNSSIYGEIGYSGIKYSPDESAVKGVGAMLGYSYSF